MMRIPEQKQTRRSDYAFWTFVIFAVIAAATSVLNVTRTYSATSGNSEIYKQLDLFGDVLERVRADYVDKPDDSMLIDAAINGMLAALDPHSAYLNPKNFKDMQVQTRGEFGGLGIEVTMENGMVKVVSPIDDTPASKAGLLTNDMITHLDGEQIVGLTLEQAVEKMRGLVNTPITLTILRLLSLDRDAGVRQRALTALGRFRPPVQGESTGPGAKGLEPDLVETGAPKTQSLDLGEPEGASPQPQEPGAAHPRSCRPSWLWRSPRGSTDLRARSPCRSGRLRPDRARARRGAGRLGSRSSPHSLPSPPSRRKVARSVGPT